MKKFLGFFQLIRFPNLIFIVLTQVLFYFCVIQVNFKKFDFIGPRLNYTDFCFLIFASVLIAAAGYIINDYFDINIDRINKPDKVVVDNLISRRWAMFFHFLFSIVGLIFTGYVSVHLSNPILLTLNIITVFTLWFYSTYFKRKLLSGNIIISLLTAWVILVLYVAEVNWSSDYGFLHQNAAVLSIYKLGAVYGGFAFIVSLIREVIKDMEDQDGDRRNKCETMPIVWGITATKLFISVWIVVLIGMLSVMFFYAFFNNWFIISIFILIFLIIPMLNLIRKLKYATKQKDYHYLSSSVKWIMLSGILSMGLYFYYNR